MKILFFPEKFGNRDYILIIDFASMNDDAEYTVVAKNIAGETKSVAQLIVDTGMLLFLELHILSNILSQVKSISAARYFLINFI